MKIADDAAQELPLNDERIDPQPGTKEFHDNLLQEPKSHNRHATVALNHLHKRRDTLTAARQKIDDELKEILDAIEALG